MSQHRQCQRPDIEAAKLNLNFIIYTCTFSTVTCPFLRMTNIWHTERNLVSAATLTRDAIRESSLFFGSISMKHTVILITG